MINYGKQDMDWSDYRALRSVIFSDWLTMGPKVEEFESKISSVCGAPSFVVSSGTAALHCAYAAIELKSGDEIITTPLTFIATQSTAMQFGARMIFCDIDQKTGNINPDLIEQLISKKTKAISVVDYAGHPADLFEIRKICDKYGLYLIEDAAHSFGSTYRGLPVGSIADITTFSFFPTKNITTGEGGAVASINTALLNKARNFARQGIIREIDQFKNEAHGAWYQEVHKLGLNYRLPDVLCALGISQIRKLLKFKKKRDLIFKFYRDNLNEIPHLQLPTKLEYVDPVWHLYPVRIKNGLRKKLYEFLWESDIRVQVNYIPAYYHPVFRDLGYKTGLCPQAEQFYFEELSLPIHPSLTRKDLNLIVKQIKLFFNSHDIK